MNKIELNIIVDKISSYNSLKKFLKDRNITILGEYFNSGKKDLFYNKSYLCNIEVLVSMEDYKAIANSSLDVSIILNTVMSFPFMGDLNNLPFVKKYMVENLPDPKEESEKYGTKDFWNERLSKIKAFLNASNLFMLKLFKNNPRTIIDYVNSDIMSFEDKIMDLDRMIEYFEGDIDDIDSQRYEDCAFLHKIKKKILKNEANKTKKSFK